MKEYMLVSFALNFILFSVFKSSILLVTLKKMNIMITWWWYWLTDWMNEWMIYWTKRVYQLRNNNVVFLSIFSCFLHNITLWMMIWLLLISLPKKKTKNFNVFSCCCFQIKSRSKTEKIEIEIEIWNTEI